MKVDPIRGAKRESRREGATKDVLLQSVVPTPSWANRKTRVKPPTHLNIIILDLPPLLVLPLSFTHPLRSFPHHPDLILQRSDLVVPLPQSIRQSELLVWRSRAGTIGVGELGAEVRELFFEGRDVAFGIRSAKVEATHRTLDQGFQPQALHVEFQPSPVLSTHG